MFSTIRRWASGSDSESLVERYTKDLSQITSKIHDLELTMKKNQANLDYWQHELTYYGSGFTMLVFAYCYWYFKDQKLLIIISVLASIIVVIFAKWSLIKLNSIVRNRRNKQLSVLRGLHQEKLEKLKEDTNFNATNSIIQRFSSGENQSEDMVLLLNEEINDKYKELNEVKEELISLKKNDAIMNDKEERDKWFDRIIGIVAGGNEVTKPIVCPKCSKHFGLFRMDRPIKYKCPECGNIIDEINNQEVNKPFPITPTDDPESEIIEKQ
ncbi:hypothetical protein Kpol_1028p77 [Vanderwaltozyma polyspora DSM 70294]|uniref:Endoplasmic reticulum junction formation protein lunapark n=1 Tax=Vanderwaltozyma polyspora (strain ATCC 22028 / DSM 70294 / BCRC 21397 / CBS 2163 / NBRC 10782 / NRRL Y-8283 / UCD 57-17) TaxID=436907 RepID=A7TG44_VANPO|nr:uncharacterized protein Kpol_1028p77 [Vanderwaltozyma polyspora DSM 70294]EDO18801.1 hypothetical protein Kpol_1028p77 [Vanderwaltozyma polyspora DSM 70294]